MNNDPAGPEWIPLMEYAMKNGVSLSTLRRQIKANKIPFKVEQGRYLLRQSSAASRPAAGATTARAFAPAPPASAPAPSQDLREMRVELQRAREEIAELKMLVALYEEQQRLNG